MNLYQDFMNCIPYNYRNNVITYDVFNNIHYFNMYVLPDTIKVAVYKNVMDYFLTNNVWLPDHIEVRGIFQ